MSVDRSQIASYYNHSSTRGATPIGLIITQFDQILRDLRRALAALDGGDIELRTSNINHAMLVIAQLQNVLDHTHGGQAARRFEQFYNVTRALLMQAQFAASREILQQCIDMYLTLRQAWHQAEVSLNSDSCRSTVRSDMPTAQSDVPQGNPVSAVSALSGVKWSA
jgi:flagellar biosynthetic protein FliS